MEKVACVIVTYNRKALLRECLDAVLSQTYPLYSVLVFNNCSTDGTELMFEEGAEYDLDIVKLINSRKNVGGAGGFSAGIKLAAEKLSCDWIWLMDDDTIPEPEALEALISASQVLKESGEAVGFLASSVYGTGGSPMNVPKLDDVPAANGYQFWHKYLEKGLVRVKEATFASVLFSADAVKKVGYPNSDYFIWGDDSEYTRRIVEEYGGGYLCGSSKVLHKRFNENKITILNENDENRIRTYRYYYRNALLNAAKYDGKLWTAVRWVYYLFLSLYLLIRPHEEHRAAKFLAVQRGMWMFLYRII